MLALFACLPALPINIFNAKQDKEYLSLSSIPSANLLDLCIYQRIFVSLTNSLASPVAFPSLLLMELP